MNICIDAEPVQAEEQVTSDYLLKIFRASIPHLPRTAAKFGTELQIILQPMIIKPSSIGGLAVSCRILNTSSRLCLLGSAGNCRLPLCRGSTSYS